MPAAALCRGKGKGSGSPGFAKPGADQRLNPPALLAAMDAPQTLGVVRDFSALIEEEAPLLTVLQFSTSSLGFRVPNPLLFGGFSPCVRLFRGRWDTYPTLEKKTAHRGDNGFYCFSQ